MSTFTPAPLSELDRIKTSFYARQKMVTELRNLHDRPQLSPVFTAALAAEIYRITDEMNRLEARWDKIEGEDR